MTPEQAIQFLSSVLPLTPVPLATHQQWMEALKVLSEAIKK